MDERTIQHPDITALERTGCPQSHPVRIELEIDAKIQRAYISDHQEDFIDWCFADPDIIRHYLEETERSFKIWVKEVLKG